MDRIELTGMEFYGYHGCLPEEREKGQPFVVDAVLMLSLKAAGERDELEDTVDYGAVFGDVKDIVEGPNRRLIEAVAEEIAARILQRQPRVESLRVSVHKPKAPLPGAFGDVSVTIERAR